MRRFSASAVLIPGGLAIAGLLVLVLWVRGASLPQVQIRVKEDAVGRGGDVIDGVAAGGRLIAGKGTPAANLPGSWPQFRGAGRDNLADAVGQLARAWPSGGPKVLWSVELGEGYAGPAIQDGRVYLLDYDVKTACDALRCLSFDTGEEIWRYSYPVAVKWNHGYSRTVPAIADGCVVTLGPKCHVTCFDAATGQLRWEKESQINLVRKYGAKVPDWYAGQCPLVDRGRVILAPCGRNDLLVAVDLKTGQPVPNWKTPNPRGWKMTHSSIMPMEFKGRRMFVYCGSGGVVGVAAEDGSILWDTTQWTIKMATVPSPVCLAEGRIFLCGGYDSGAMMLQLEERGGAWTVHTRFRLKASVFGSTQQTPILYQGHLFGIRQRDKELVCLDLDGKQVWRSGADHRFGDGPYMIADGLMYLLSDKGVLTLAEVSSAGYKQLAQAQVLDGHEAWAPLALAAGRLLARDETRMVCLDVKKN
jgi:outer membrane protein assembly factor BamB